MKIINKTIFDIEELKKKKNDLHQNLLEQVEKLQELKEVNARVVRKQEKYQKEYDALVS